MLLLARLFLEEDDDLLEVEEVDDLDLEDVFLFFCEELDLFGLDPAEDDFGFDVDDFGFDVDDLGFDVDAVGVESDVDFEADLVVGFVFVFVFCIFFVGCFLVLLVFL